LAKHRGGDSAQQQDAQNLFHVNTPYGVLCPPDNF
jgi:hypothetical protein